MTITVPVDHVPDFEVRQKFKLLELAADDATANKIAIEHLDIRFSCGYPKPMVTKADIPDLQQAIARHLTNNH